MDLDSSPDKKHRHHKKHKHKKHKKHRKGIKEMSEAEEGSTEQEIELDQIEYSMDMIHEEAVTIPAEEHFLMDAEHCEGALEVIEELVEIDVNDISTINMEEMALENYGQVDYDELDVVDVDGVDEEILEDIEEDLLDDVEESEDEDLEEEEQEEDDEEEEQEPIDNTPEKPKPVEDSSRKRVRDRSKRTRDDGEGSSGEEAWLKALESGKLEEVDDELKKIKNPKLMTVRQRALLERKGELQNEEIIKEELVALPTGYKETVMTEELLKKKAIKSERRREVAAQKREKEKKRTIDRLLLKKESKLNKSCAASISASTSSASVSVPSHVSSYTWKQTQDGEITFSVPIGAAFPLAPQSVKEPPARVNCGVQGCTNVKRYSCSKTAVPLCSIQCYRKNMTLHRIS
ncbi:INO80 complex subunit B-like [Daphnia pulex]|uniref:INO80 complex subunit B-like n=1 Tax=Daphnia pulex TaxID=6669 RepID=UPI001EDDDC9C|nr:INO80 complex subunit B-like [Daphnia pulex]